MKNINEATPELQKIMEAEGATEFELTPNGGARIYPVDGKKLYISETRLKEAAAEIRLEGTE